MLRLYWGTSLEKGLATNRFRPLGLLLVALLVGCTGDMVDSKLDCEAGCSDGQTCVDGQCVDDVVDCAGPEDCTTPAACELAYGAACDNGQCAYPRVSCVTPPEGACVDDDTYRRYEPAGQCNSATGECEYAYSDVICVDCASTCAGLCATVACTPSRCETGGVCDPTNPPGYCRFGVAEDGADCELDDESQGVCSSGACVQCREASDCPAATGEHPECFFVACVANACVVTPLSIVECEPQSCTDGVIYFARQCGSEGACLPPTPAIQSCNGYACDGASGTCKTTCAVPEDCVGGLPCLPSGECQAPKATGDPCNVGGECATGYCANEVCCDRACNGTCDACNKAGSVGTCVSESTACSGNCGACVENLAEARFDCTAQLSMCTGDCDTCSGSGTAFSCVVDPLCGQCGSSVPSLMEDDDTLVLRANTFWEASSLIDPDHAVEIATAIQGMPALLRSKNLGAAGDRAEQLRWAVKAANAVTTAHVAVEVPACDYDFSTVFASHPDATGSHALFLPKLFLKRSHLTLRGVLAADAPVLWYAGVGSDGLDHGRVLVMVPSNLSDVTIKHLFFGPPVLYVGAFSVCAGA